MFKRMRFSDVEIKDLTKSFLAIGVAFTIAQVGLNILSAQFTYVLIVSLITVGIGFLLHEMAHKYFAQRFGCWSEFRSNDRMLLFAIGLSFLGMVFVAPGAVWINGYMSRKQNGIVSAAGPITNLVLAMVFLALSPLGMIATIGFTINTWLALFNMIPIMPFDGSKILKWNKFVYGGIVAVAILFMVIAAI